MTPEITSLRDQLAGFVRLVENVISEGERLSPAPESLGFCDQAHMVFSKYLKQIDHGLREAKASLVVHAILRIDSSLEEFTEADLAWSILWNRSDARGSMRGATQHLLRSLHLVAREEELERELVAAKWTMDNPAEIPTRLPGDP